jgi:hypothetical protein
MILPFIMYYVFIYYIHTHIYINTYKIWRANLARRYYHTYRGETKRVTGHRDVM